MQAGICVLTVTFGIRFDLFRFIQLLKNRQAINSSSIEFVLHFQLSDCHHCFVLSIVYFSYHGQHTIETIAATFQGSRPQILWGDFQRLAYFGQLPISLNFAGISAGNCTKMEMVQRYLMYCQIYQRTIQRYLMNFISRYKTTHRDI